MSDPIDALHRNWCLLLEVDEADPAQNFYDLGGDSLVALDLFTRVADESGWELPIEVLFVEGTFGALAQHAFGSTDG